MSVTDRNLDGIREITVSAPSGRNPHTKVFGFPSLNLMESFLATDPGFVGGVPVA